MEGSGSVQTITDPGDQTLTVPTGPDPEHWYVPVPSGKK